MHLQYAICATSMQFLSQSFHMPEMRYVFIYWNMPSVSFCLVTFYFIWSCFIISCNTAFFKVCAPNNMLKQAKPKGRLFPLSAHPNLADSKSWNVVYVDSTPEWILTNQHGQNKIPDKLTKPWDWPVRIKYPHLFIHASLDSKLLALLLQPPYTNSLQSCSP